MQFGFFINYCLLTAVVHAWNPPAARLLDQDIARRPILADKTSGMSDKLTLSDVVGGERSIGVFASLLRDVASAAELLRDTRSNATILAPTNAQMSDLPRKPWENPDEYSALGANAYEGSAGQDRAQQNIRKFVEAHIVPVSPIVLGTKMKTLAGSTIWLEDDNGKKIIRPDGVEVVQVADVVSNGELWVIKGVLAY